MRKAFIFMALVLTVSMLADSASDLFPLEVGRWWAYNDSTPDGYRDYITTVTDMEMIEGIPNYYVVEADEVDPPDTTVFQVKSDGIYSELDMSDMGYTEPIPMLVMPSEVTVGDSWESFRIDTVMDVGSGMMADVFILTTGHAIGYEDIGEYTDCMRIQMYTTFMISMPPFYEDSSDFVADEQWLKSGIGTVKSYVYNFDPMGESTSSVAYLTAYGIGDFVGEKGIVPEELQISAAPNPFNGGCEIMTAPMASIEIYDVRGILVDRLDSDISGRAVWSPENRASGVYTARVFNKNTSVTEKLIYVK